MLLDKDEAKNCIKSRGLGQIPKEGGDQLDDNALRLDCFFSIFAFYPLPSLLVSFLAHILNAALLMHFHLHERDTADFGSSLRVFASFLCEMIRQWIQLKKKP